MKTLVTGASGLIGRSLIQQLDSVRVLSRNPARAGQELGVEAMSWRPSAEVLDPTALADVGVVFHLAGEPVAEGRWSEAKKQRILDSRVLGTRHLVSGLRQAASRPRVLICASAVGYYGDRGDEVLDENSSPGSDFLAQVCVDWEREAMRAEELGVRVVCVRIGVVQSTEGGALPKLLSPTRFGVGASLGSGRQWMSWIHLDDVVRLLRFASLEEVCGPINAVAPHPVTNREFTQTLARILNRPAALRVPAMALKLGLGQMSQVVLASQRVRPMVAEQSGFRFRFPELEPALRNLLGREKSATTEEALHASR